MTVEAEPQAVLRERLAEALTGLLPPARDDAYAQHLADALLPVVAAELAEAKRDAELGWKDAQERQDQCEERAETCKRLMAHIDQLGKLLAPHRGACGAIVSTVEGQFGPCTIGGPHHPSFPHQDAEGARWQVLVLPAAGEGDDLTQRLAAAYYKRFDNDGHPEDTTAAVEVAMAVVEPELDRLAAEAHSERTHVNKLLARVDAETRRAERAEATVARALELLKQVPHEVLPGVPGHEHLSVRRAIAALDGTGEAS